MKVRSLKRTGSITSPAGKLASYKLDLAGVWEVKLDKRGTVTVEITVFFCGKETKIIN